VQAEFHGSGASMHVLLEQLKHFHPGLVFYILEESFTGA
jgi:hypothetical protein